MCLFLGPRFQRLVPSTGFSFPLKMRVLRTEPSETVGIQPGNPGDIFALTEGLRHGSRLLTADVPRQMSRRSQAADDVEGRLWYDQERGVRLVRFNLYNGIGDNYRYSTLPRDRLMLRCGTSYNRRHFPPSWPWSIRGDTFFLSASHLMIAPDVTVTTHSLEAQLKLSIPHHL